MIYLNCIKLYNLINVKELIRDMVHTNDKGGYFYGNEIYKYFRKKYLYSFEKKNNIIKKFPINNEFNYDKIFNLEINKLIYDNIILTDILR
jgi:hypothetical protein